MKKSTPDSDPGGGWFVSLGPEEWDARVAEYDAEHDADGAAAHESFAAPTDGPSPIARLRGTLNELDNVVAFGRRALAEQYALIADVLSDAERDAEPWVGPDPTLWPDWVDPRERSIAEIRRERVRFARRSACADIAVRLRISEQTVAARASRAETLRERCPRVWDMFQAGAVEEQSAITIADLAGSLPPDAADVWGAFDDGCADAAAVLTPAKLRTRARAIRERVHPESLQERHTRAAQARGVWVDPMLDGMASFNAIMTADAAYTAFGRIDAFARHLATADDEERTLAQLRADVFADLLRTGEIAETTSSDGSAADVSANGAGASGASGSGSRPPRAPRTTVAVTVPVMTLLGHDDAPATLDGYGPIDLETARRLAGEATSWVRILTHPVTGAVLDLDRTTYRVPAALRRWLGVAHPTCIFPGCSRSAAECDVDHRTAWADGGTTSADNLAPQCRSHHRVRHESRWRLDQDEAGDLRWTSPTGRATAPDPIPF